MAAKSRYWALLVFVLALSLRLGYLYEIADNPFFVHPVVDAKVYLDNAAKLCRGEVSDIPAQKACLYPIFLALKIKLLGQRVLILRSLQMFIGAFTCCLIYWLSLLFWQNKYCGLISGILAASYGPLIYFDGELLPAQLQVLTYTLFLYFWLRWRDEEKVWKGALCGLALALSAIGHGFALLLYPAFCFWSLFERKKGFLLFLVFSLTPIFALSYYNTQTTGRFVLISLAGGRNLYLGNNADASRTEKIRPGNDWQELFRKARGAGHVTEASQDQYFRKLTWFYWTQNPRGALKNFGRKFLVFLSGEETLRNQSIYPMRSHSKILAVLLWKLEFWAFPFGFLLPISALGASIYFRRGQTLCKLTALLLVIIFHSLGVILFFVTSRYRLPIIPFLLVLAGGAFHWFICRFFLKRLCTDGECEPLSWPCIALVLLLLLVSRIGVTPLHYRWSPQDWYVLAAKLHESGEPELALQYAKKSIDVDAGYADGHFYVGLLEHQTGQEAKALWHLKRAVALEPSHFDAWTYLGALLGELKLFEEAIFALEQARAIDKESIITIHNLGVVSLNAHRYEEALAAFQRAIAHRKRGPQSFIGLAETLTAMKEKKKSLQVLEEAYAAYPANEQIKQMTLGLIKSVADEVVLAKGSWQKVDELLNRSLAIERAQPEVLYCLAISKMKQGHSDKAKELLREALSLDGSFKEAKALLHSLSAK